MMIPTLFGISFVVWLVMMMAPGRPGDTAAAAMGGEENVSRDPAKLAGQDQAQRVGRPVHSVSIVPSDGR